MNQKRSYIKPEMVVSHFTTKEFWMAANLSGAVDPGMPGRRPPTTPTVPAF